MFSNQRKAVEGDAAHPAPRRKLTLSMTAVIFAAAIATTLAYRGMTLFALDVAGMAPVEAYALAGFLEVSLVAVALMARSAAVEGRPYGVLLTLTWLLSGASGVFAALHEIAVLSHATPYMVVFRFVPPLVAALMWHLALVGERHLVTGNSIDERRRERGVHAYVVAQEAWRDRRHDSRGGALSRWRVRRAYRSKHRARDRALRLMAVEEFDERVGAWVVRLESDKRHGERLDALVPTAAMRGTADQAREEAATPEADEAAPVVLEEAPKAVAAAPQPVSRSATVSRPPKKSPPAPAAQPSAAAPVAAAQTEQVVALTDRGYTYGQVADELGISISTVKRRLRSFRQSTTAADTHEAAQPNLVLAGAR